MIGLFFLIWTALSLIPLPAFVLKSLSPKSFQIWETTALVGGQFPNPLSLYPYMTLNSLVFGLALFFFYRMALYGIRSNNQIHWLMIGIMILGSLESIYALVQLAAAQPYILWWRKTVDENVATGTFINRNHLADFLALIVCLGVGYLWALVRENEGMGVKGKQALVYRAGIHIGALGARGIVLLLILSLMIAALLTTASRGGTLALMVGLIFMGGMIITRFLRTRKAVILLLSLSLVCSYVSYTAIDRVLERFQRFELNLEDRLIIAKNTFQMAKAFPLTGSGLGTFEFIFPGYQGYITDRRVDYAHNDWVQLFAETGGIGLMILGGGFLWFMGHSIVLWRKRRNSFSVGIGLGGLGAMVAVAVHSLMDFSLHIPANALLLTLIVAITTLVLHYHRSGGHKIVFPARSILKISLWTTIPFFILVTLLLGILSLRTIRVWQADSLARSVWNSTIPFKEPSDSDLIKAWTLAPGKAQYWTWLASRASQKPALSIQMEKSVKKGSKDIPIYLLEQGIMRNPTAWNIWRNLSWAAFLKSDKEPKVYFPLAEQASFQAFRFRPFFFQGYLDFGMIGLASYTRKGGRTEKIHWVEAFNQALSLNPNLSPLVADQILLYLGREGAKEISGSLPQEAQAFLLTGVHLLKQGIFKEGMEILGQGERYREREIERFWEQMSQERAGAAEKRQKILEQLFSLDPQYPGALLVQGRVLEALTSQDRRWGVLGELADRKELAWNLKFLEGRNPGSVAGTAYFLGRLAEEDGDLQKARSQFQRALAINSQFFPAWIHLEKVLKKAQRSEGDRIELENLQRKVRFFEMAEVVGDAWVWEGISAGLPVWKASYRTGKKQEMLEINFSGDTRGAWKLMLDGRFVAAWTGSPYAAERKMMIPEGEHEFRLIGFTDSIKKPPEKIPFKLNIKFE